MLTRFTAGLLGVGALLIGLDACVFDGSGLPGRSVNEDFSGDLPSADLADLAPELNVDSAPTCVEETCLLGCNTAEDRCFRITPSNLDPRGFYEVAKRAVVLDGGSVEINADTGEIPGYRSVSDPPASGGVYWAVMKQRDGSDVAVFAMGALRVQAGTSVRVRGSYPVIFFVRRQVEIAGAISVAADVSGPGPGGRAGGARDKQNGDPMCHGSGRGGGEREVLSNEWEAGGGGGGFGAIGARGASVRCNLGVAAHEPALGGDGGDSFGNLKLVPLVGGCGGGAGGGPDLSGVRGAGGAGGAGGGALQISVGEKLVVSAEGSIDAGGGGGWGGESGAGGGGGGSGGAVLLEAPVLQIDGRVVANGGGGGAGSAYGLSANTANSGQPGQLSGDQAAGGKAEAVLFGVMLFGTNGGRGGAALGAAERGVDSDDLCNGGGGGGGVGRIRLNCNPPQPSGKLSPSASFGSLLPPW